MSAPVDMPSGSVRRRGEAASAANSPHTPRHQQLPSGHKRIRNTKAGQSERHAPHPCSSNGAVSGSAERNRRIISKASPAY